MQRKFQTEKVSHIQAGHIKQSAYKRSGWCFQLAQATLGPQRKSDLHQHMTPQRVEKDLANSVKYELAIEVATSRSKSSFSFCSSDRSTFSIHSGAWLWRQKRWMMFVVVRKEMVSADSSRVTSPSSSYLHAGMAAHYEGI